MVKKVCAVLASGPSLNQSDVDLIDRSGLFTIAVNTTWQMAPWCDILYAGDNCWWRANIEEIEAANLPCKRYSCSKPAESLYGATYRERKVKPGYNSGANACELAAFLGYNVIIMLGFDCSVKHGIHHHGPHKKTGNPNQIRCDQWKSHFSMLNKIYPKVKFINCSRYTELKCFKRLDLLEAIDLYT